MQGQGTEGRAGLQDSILRFLQLFEKKGEGRAEQGLSSERLRAGQHRARAKARGGKGRVQGRQGAGRVGQGRAGQAGRRQGAGHRAQGQGTKGRVGLQDSILRFSRPQNLK